MDGLVFTNSGGPKVMFIKSARTGRMSGFHFGVATQLIDTDASSDME